MRPLFGIERYYNTALMRVGIVINPISGSGGSRTGEAARRRSWAASSALASGVDAAVVVTERRGHACEVSRAFVSEGRDAVIAMGGDGTVNEVARALVGTGTALGIVPSGSGDGFARGLGLPSDRDSAMQVALSPEATAVDVGYAGDRLFLNIAGVGFDAAVAMLFATRSTRGALGYVATVVRLVWTYVAPDYDVRWHTRTGEQVRQGRRFLIGFANAPAYGNFAVLAPDASPEDGALDLLLVKAGSPLTQFWRARRLFWRHRHRAHGLERARVTRATIRGSTIVCHVDGEPFETSGTLEISVRPGALLVRTGKGS